MLVQTKDDSQFWMCLRLPTRERRHKHFVGKKRTRFYDVKKAVEAVIEEAREYAPAALPALPPREIPKTVDVEFVGPPDLRQMEGELILAWIKRWVAHNHGVTVAEIEGPRRWRHLVAARQEYFFYARTIAKRSLPVIGASCGNRDHTTILHGARKQASKLGISWEVLDIEGYPS